MKNNIVDNFFKHYFAFATMRSVYADSVPKAMMASAVDEEGWFTWQAIDGTLSIGDYQKLAEKFNVKFPQSFIAFHKRYFFFDGDCALLRLPYSNPNEPFQEIIDLLDNETAYELIKINIYPFAMEGNDAGFLVFDGREDKLNNEFPIRVFDHLLEELDGLGPVIFSTFDKLLECLTYYMEQIKTRHDFEIIPEFLKIDPNGAGLEGRDYWMGWVDMQKENYEFDKENPLPF